MEWKYADDRLEYRVRTILRSNSSIAQTAIVEEIAEAVNDIFLSSNGRQCHGLMFWGSTTKTNPFITDTFAI